MLKNELKTTELKKIKLYLYQKTTNFNEPLGPIKSIDYDYLIKINNHKFLIRFNGLKNPILKMMAFSPQELLLKIKQENLLISRIE